MTDFDDSMSPNDSPPFVQMTRLKQIASVSPGLAPMRVSDSEISEHLPGDQYAK